MVKKEKSKKIIIIIIFVLVVILIGVLLGILINKKDYLKTNSTDITQKKADSLISDESNNPEAKSNDSEIENTTNIVEINTTNEVKKDNDNTSKVVSKITTTNAKTVSTNAKQTTSTTKKITTSTTKKTTTNTTVVTTKKTIVKEEKIEEKELLETKYGVDKNKVIVYNVITYSDNTIDKVKKSENYKLDYSGYNATTTDLMEEARSVSNSNMSTYNEVVAKVNEYRQEAGVNSITLDNNLCLAATIRAMELAYANKFAHTRPNGKSFSSILKDLNISYYTAGENIAAGQTSVSAVTKSWYDSAGHRENMENKEFSKIGVGKYRLPYSKWNTYWVQIFTN